MSLLVAIVRQTVDDILSAPGRAFVCLMPCIAGAAILIGLLVVYSNLITGFPGTATIAAAVILFVIFVFTCYTWTAVAWHRMVILSEPSRGLMPPWPGSLITGYIGRSLLLMILLLLLMIPFFIVFSAVNTVLPLGSDGQSFKFMLGEPPTSFAPQYLLVWVLFNGILAGLLLRISLILPGGAIGHPIPLAAAWDATRGHFLSLFVPLGLLLPIINLVFSLVSSVASFGGVLEILSAMLLLLLGIGVVTRLYMLFFPTANADGSGDLPLAA
jgi:hypothetical protein